MKELDLSGLWKLESTGGISCGGTVPGTVYSFLTENSLMEDPCFRDNELQALALMNDTFTFFRNFDLPKEMRGSARILLHCEGLDTFCEVFLNGEAVGKANNMHRTWEFDLTGPLKPTRNRLELRFPPPLKPLREAQAADPLPGSGYTMPGFSHLRKAHCMFGWSCTPCLPDVGIWRKIVLLGEDSSRIESLRVEQRHENGQVWLTVHLQQTGEGIPRLLLTTPDGELFPMKAETETEILDPKLWWPHGYGGQPLYSLSAELWEDGSCMDQASYTIGLRTMALIRSKDEWGESFCHCVNDVRIFAMGACYLPEDALLSRLSPARTRTLLEDCVRANFNCIRVWGGGVYPADSFFDLCDELGLLVWQDMPFAEAGYRLSSLWEQGLSMEFVDNIRRIRQHPCLALWCGNDKVEQFLASRQADFLCRADYIKLFEYLLPQLLEREDPDTPYWPASPSSGGGFDDPNGDSRGDVHEEIGYVSELAANGNSCGRYVSAFGFPAYPSMQVLETFTDSEDRNAFSPVIELHQRRLGGGILSDLAQDYLLPTEFGLLPYATQLVQAERVRQRAEHFRQNRGRCMGALYWHLNDSWPAISCSSIGFGGEWKALHYYAKRFFAPLLVSCQVSLPQRETLGFLLEKGKEAVTAQLVVTNETRRKRSGTVRWELREADGSIRRSGAFDLDIPPLSAKRLEKLDFTGVDVRERYLSYCYEERGKELSVGTALFTSPKEFHLREPRFSYRLEQGRILLRAEAFAKSVEIRSPDGELLLSDNYFDMNAGTVAVEILRGTPTELRFRSVYDLGKR